jgi:hypothetical protein
MMRWIVLSDQARFPKASLLRYYYCRHPSIRTLDERFLRSVQVGCSRFSRCCHLIFDLSFHLNDESRARPLTQSPKLGA